MVSMDVDGDKKALFNEVYDQEHVPNLLKVPGVHAARRIKAEPAFRFNIAGEEKEIIHQGASYCAVYEIDGPQVLLPGVGASRRGGTLARPGAPVHTLPPPRAL